MAQQARNLNKPYLWWDFARALQQHLHHGQWVSLAWTALRSVSRLQTAARRMQSQVPAYATELLPNNVHYSSSSGRRRIDLSCAARLQPPDLRGSLQSAA